MLRRFSTANLPACSHCNRLYRIFKDGILLKKWKKYQLPYRKERLLTDTTFDPPRFSAGSTLKDKYLEMMQKCNKKEKMFQLSFFLLKNI